MQGVARVPERTGKHSLGTSPVEGERQFLSPSMFLTSTARLQPLALQRKPRAEKFNPVEEGWGVCLWRVLGSGSVMEGVL